MSGRRREGLLHALSLEAQPGVVGRGRVGARLVGVGQLLGAPALLAPDEVDRPPVHEREDPGAGLGPLGDEAPGRAPDGEERLLHRVLGKRLVAQHAQCQAVGHAMVPVVELGERGFFRARDERNDRLVGEVGKVPGHDPDSTTKPDRFGRSCSRRAAT